MSVASGDVLSSSFSVENLLTNYGSDNGPSGAGYWLAPWLAPNNNPAAFVLNLGCGLSFTGIQLVNTHNRGSRDRATKLFR